MSRQQILERERRLRPWVVVASILPLLLLVAAALTQSAAAPGDLATETLRSINEHSTAQMIGSVFGAVAFVLLVVPLVYLFRAAQARAERMLGGLIIVTILGPVLFGVQAVLLTVGQIDVADQFVAQESGVGDIYSLATNLLEESGTRDVALGISSMAVVAMIFAMIYTPLWAMRTGLLPRFHATLGMALGASFILPPLTQITLPALLAWFMYFGAMQLGRVPRGRPPAWDAGEAIPWPVAGQEPEPVAAGPGDDVIEGDASEIPGVAENPNAARRERAKRRKRKRRR